MIEIRPGEGGDDAVDFAQYLLKCLEAFLLREKHTRTLTNTDRTFCLETDAPIELVDSFGGTHRVQRTPSNGKGRRHTSTATVAILPIRSRKNVTISDDDLRIDRLRGTGRGGQRRNKRETAVRVTHLPSGNVVTRLSGRSQVQNLADAIEELQQRLVDTANNDADQRIQRVREGQTNTERSGKTFTHVFYRDEVVNHLTGQHWHLKDWKQGRM